jgi:hypothetical protein
MLSGLSIGWPESGMSQEKNEGLRMTRLEQVRDPDIASKHLGDLVCDVLAVNELKPEPISEENYTECFRCRLGDSRHKVKKVLVLPQQCGFLFCSFIVAECHEKWRIWS